MAERNPGIYNRLEPYEKKLARDRNLKSKLSDVCLNSIVQHFERHMIAYKSGMEPKHYEFLQRRASEDIINIFSEEDRDWPSYSENFLINPFVTELSVTNSMCYSGFPVGNIFAIGENIRKLSIRGHTFTEDVLNQLTCNLPNVESLTIADTPRIRTRILQNILRHCPCLESLQLDGSISDDVFQDVFDNQDAGNEFPCKAKLKEFWVLDSKRPRRMTAVGIVYLLNYFPNLVHVDSYFLFDAIQAIYSDNVRNNTLPIKTHKVKALDISDFPNVDLQTLRRIHILCPHLVKLTLFDLRSQGEVDALVGFSTLEEVFFEEVSGESINFSTFVEQNGKKLKVFKIVASDVAIISVESLLNSCPNLEVLEMESVMFQPMQEGYFNTRRLCEMKTLSLITDLSSQSSVRSLYTILSCSPNLKVLNLAGCEHVSRHINSIIASCASMNIRELDVNSMDDDVNKHDIKEFLLACPTIEQFTISADVFLYKHEFVQDLPPHINKVWIDIDDYNGVWKIYLMRNCMDQRRKRKRS